MKRSITENFGKVVQSAWERTFNVFYYPKTHMIYDMLMGESIEETLDLYPTPEEIKNSIPNPCGWGTCMENSTLNFCVMLEAIIARYKVTADPNMKRYADELIQGLIINGTVSKEKGFIARCVAPSDGKSYYIDSSRDQYTHWIYAAHMLLSSSLATDAQKQTLREVLIEIAKKAERDVKPENKGCMCRVDGKPGIVSAMDSPELAPHEILRLPMIYAAAYEASGDEHWLKTYHGIRDRFLDWAEEKYTLPWLENTAKNGGSVSGVEQHQYSVRALYDIETEPEYRERYRKQLEISADASTYFLKEAYKNLEAVEIEEPFRENWRNNETFDWCGLGYRYVVPIGHQPPKEREGVYIPKWRIITNITIPMKVKCLCPDYKIGQDDLKVFCKMVEKCNPTNAKCEWIFSLCCAWWLLKEKGIV